MLIKRTQSIGLAILAGLCVIACCIGCSDDKATDPTGGGSGGDPDSLLQVANDSLGTLMVEMIEQTLENADSSFRPEDVDFTSLHLLYNRVLGYDPANKDAHFGAAFTGLMSFMADDAFNDLYERVRQLVDTQFSTMTPSFPRIEMSREAMPNGIPLTPGGLTKSVYDPLRFSNRLASAAAADPLVSELQDIFQTRLLPLVAKARANLTYIVGDPDYEFALTPEMQGNPGANTIYLDRSDFRVFLASAYLFESVIHIFLSRNLDVVSYDVEGAFEAARQNSSFLDLRSGDHMPTAKAQLLSGRTEAVNAINDLLAEITSGEDQSDDLIKVYASDADDLTEIRDSLVSLGTYFESPHEIEMVFNEECYCYWNGYYCEWYCTEDTLNLTVNISEFFDNPVDNLKSLIPQYTLTLDTLDVDLYEVCYIWDAPSFAEWTWPNPTINGLLPGMTSDSLNTLIGMDADGWKPTDCDTLDLR